MFQCSGECVDVALLKSGPHIGDLVGGFVEYLAGSKSLPSFKFCLCSLFGWFSTS